MLTPSLRLPGSRVEAYSSHRVDRTMNSWGSYRYDWVFHGVGERFGQGGAAQVRGDDGKWGRAGRVLKIKSSGQPGHYLVAFAEDNSTKWYKCHDTLRRKLPAGTRLTCSLGSASLVHNVQYPPEHPRLALLIRAVLAPTYPCGWKRLCRPTLLRPWMPLCGHWLTVGCSNLLLPPTPQLTGTARPAHS